MKYLPLLFVSIFLVAADAWAVTRIVAPGGTNTNCPTMTATPAGSIQTAINCSVDNDTVTVRAGTYTGGIDIGSRNGFTLATAVGETVLLRNNGSVISISAVISGFTLRGFDISCNDAVGDALIVFNTAALNGGSIIENNRMHNCADGLILGSGDNLTIRNNTLYDIVTCYSPNLCHAIYTYLTNSFIYNNVIYNMQGGYAMQFNGGNNVKVYNNTVVQGQAWGITVWNHSGTGATNFQIDNNIITNFTSEGLSFYNTGGGHVVRNNLFFQNGGSGTIIDTGSSYTASGTLTANPLFVDPSTLARNYQLQGSPVLSPAINSGLSTNCPTTDFLGNTRSGACDRGAYEFQTPPTSGIVTWTNDRGGSGTASGTANWKTDVPPSGIPFKAGINPITVTATDTAGVTTTDTITITYAPSFPGATLALAYGFEEASGTSATDSSTNKNTGTLNNGPTRLIGTGKFGNGISLNGLTQYITANSAASLDFTQSFTFSAYVKPHAAYSDFKALMVKDVTGGNGYVQFLYATVAGYCASGRALGGFQANGPIIGTQFTACDPTTAISVGAWTHLAVTYDIAATGQELKLYRNGALVITMPASGYMEPSTGQFRIGASQFAGTLYEFLDADVDEIRAYNVAIPATDGKLNTVFGAACGYSTASVAAAAADRLNMALVSVMGDANCAVIQPVAPTGPALKIPQAPSGVKVSSGSTMKLSQ